MKKNEIYTTNIIDLGMDGEGVAKIERMPVFVPYAVKGDLAKIKIIHVKKHLAYGKLLEIVKPSEFRIQPKCPYFGKCGGCDIQHIDYLKGLDFKREKVKTCMRKSIGEIPVKETVHGQNYAYRNKLQVPLDEKNGEIIAGVYRKLSHDIVPIDECLLYSDWAKELIKIFLDWANGKFGNPKLTAYNEKTREGLLRHIVARMVDNFLTVTIVINGDKLPYYENLINVLQTKFDFNLFVNINKKNTNVIMGQKLIKIYGKDKLININDIKLSLSPMSFLQINDEIRDKIYKKTIDILHDVDIVIDVYSGVGILSAMIAKNIKSEYSPCVYGVEIIPDATHNADDLMRLNGLSNKVKNICGDAAEIVPNLTELTVKLYKNVVKPPNIAVVLDPPRKGCDAKVLNAIMKAQPQKIIYISCNPATLARDLKILTEDYQITECTPYDMFPQTKHVECVVLMSRVEK